MIMIFLRSVYGEQIDGIIGYSFLSRYIVKMDYDSSKISILYQRNDEISHGVVTCMNLLLRTLPVQTARIKRCRKQSIQDFYLIWCWALLLLIKDFVEDSAFFR